MKKASLLLLLIIALGINNRIYAQTLGTATQSPTMTVQISSVLDLQPISSVNTYNFSSIAILDAGITQTNAVVLGYKANNLWHVNIMANSPTFSEVAGGNPTPMPASVIQWMLHGGSTFTPLTTTAASVNGN